jgi:hypothetical protein
MEVLDSVLKVLASAEGAALTIAVVLEFVFRLVPSKKPLSMLYAGAALLHVLAEIMEKCSLLARRAGALLDKVLPQVSAEEAKDQV